MPGYEWRPILGPAPWIVCGVLRTVYTVRVGFFNNIEMQIFEKMFLNFGIIIIHIYPNLDFSLTCQIIQT